MGRHDSLLMTYAQAFERLAAEQVATAIVEFEGGHDSGSISGIALQDENGVVIRNLSDTIMWEWDRMEKRHQMIDPTPDHILCDTLSRPVFDKYGSFAGEYSVYGTVTWNVKEKTVVMDQNMSVETYEHSEDTIFSMEEDGEEEESNV